MNTDASLHVAAGPAASHVIYIMMIITWTAVYHPVWWACSKYTRTAVELIIFTGWMLRAGRLSFFALEGRQTSLFMSSVWTSCSWRGSQEWSCRSSVWELSTKHPAEILTNRRTAAAQSSAMCRSQQERHMAPLKITQVNYWNRLYLPAQQHNHDRITFLYETEQNTLFNKSWRTQTNISLCLFFLD